MDKKTQKERELESQLFKLRKEFEAYRKYNSYIQNKENVGVTITVTFILLAIGGIMAVMLQFGIPL